MRPGPTAEIGCGRKRNCPDGSPIVYNVPRLKNVGKHLPTIDCSTAQKQQRSSIVCVECDVALCLKCFILFLKV